MYGCQGLINTWAQWALAQGPNKHRGPTSIFIPVNSCYKSPSALPCPGANSAIKTDLIVVVSIVGVMGSEEGRKCFI